METGKPGPVSPTVYRLVQPRAVPPNCTAAGVNDVVVGGIDSVTLSDEEARRRGTQKTVLERRAPPTFDVLVEIQDRQTFAVHHDVGRAVDMLLRQKPLVPEIRYRNEAGEIKIEQTSPPERGQEAQFSQRRDGEYGDFRGRSAASGIAAMAVLRWPCR